MPRGDKSAYTDKQKRKARYIEESYKNRGMSDKEAEAAAWAIVNKTHGGGEKSGSGRGQPENPEPSRKGGRLGGAATKRAKSVKRTKAKKSRKARNAAKTKARARTKKAAARKRKPKARKRRS